MYGQNHRSWHGVLRMSPLWGMISFLVRSDRSMIRAFLGEGGPVFPLPCSPNNRDMDSAFYFWKLFKNVFLRRKYTDKSTHHVVTLEALIEEKYQQTDRYFVRNKKKRKKYTPWTRLGKNSSPVPRISRRNWQPDLCYTLRWHQGKWDKWVTQRVSKKIGY